MMTAHDAVAAYWAAAQARDWQASGQLVADDVLYRGPQAREPVRGRDAYLRFNAEGFPSGWQVEVKRIVADGRGAASWVELTDADGTMTGVCFFDFTEDGKIQAITDFWPTRAELPASRVHLVERY